MKTRITGPTAKRALLGVVIALCASNLKAGPEEVKDHNSAVNVPLPVKDASGRYSYRYMDGRVAFKETYEVALCFKEERALIFQDERYGYGHIDTKGNRISSQKFEGARDFHNGLAAVKVNSKWGYIDRQGKIAIQPQFNRAQGFAQDNAWVLVGGRYREDWDIVIGGKWGLIDRNGNWRITPKFIDVVSPLDDYGWAAVSEHESREDALGWRIVRKDGQFTGDVIFAWSVEPFDSGIALVASDFHNKRFVGTSGATAVEIDGLRDAGSFSEGLAPVAVDGSIRILWGFVDASGAWKIQPKYLSAQPFSEGLAAICTQDGWGYIDKKGKIAIPPSFLRAERFGECTEGIAFVTDMSGAEGYISKQGEFLPRGTEYAFAGVTSDTTFGMSREALLKKFGKPRDESEFSGQDLRDSRHSNIWRALPTTKRNDSLRLIVHDVGDDTLYSWLVQNNEMTWQVFLSIRAAPGIMF